MINNTYYKGFEGEPEIQFILKKSEDYILSLWEGYFDRIMMLIPPSESGWTGIAYSYHMCNAWDETELWEVEDIADTYNKFNAVPKENLDKKSVSVLNEICGLLSEALVNNYKIFIRRE